LTKFHSFTFSIAILKHKIKGIQ